MSEALLDVNVVIAAHLTNHADHLKARQFVWFTRPLLHHAHNAGRLSSFSDASLAK
jgi:hypothetical protein